MKKVILFSTVLMMVFAFSLSGAVAGQNKGAKEMKLDGGSKGEVPFTHSKHQERLGDCNVCHSLFPQSSGAIDENKQKGDLKKKQVMNTLCIKCHKSEKKKGNAYGPVTCSKCHVRK